jgi:LmbE family N-acetylglucosaminyl deacetylase
MSEKENKAITSLIIVPHPDDEVLSFGGYMIDQLSEGNNIVLSVMCIGHNNESYKKRNDELHSMVNALRDIHSETKGKITLVTNTDKLDGVLDRYPTNYLVSDIDKLIDEYKPDVLMSCYPSSHQDHRTLYNAVQSSLRLRDGFMPKKVAFGEYPFILPSLELPSGGKWYHVMSNVTFKQKCDLFRLYKSQFKKSPSPLGINGIKVLANTRGLEIGETYAELYYIQKEVN